MLQKEIDTVIGSSRLPTVHDRARLPYTEAVAKEIFRWNAVVPSGLLHYLNEDDIYDGYFIPATSTIIANIEGMLHDERTYRDPYTFDPTRFLPHLSGRPSERNPHTIGFGFGRRKRSGMRLAESSLFIACAMIGATLDIQKPTKDGHVVEPVFEKLPGLISHPKPFDVVVKPRTKKAEQLLGSE